MARSYAARNIMSRSFVSRVARRVTRDEDARMKLGFAIKTLREEANLTLDDLADMTGTTKPNLSRIEGGQWPRPELLEAIADALNIKTYQLFARADGITLPTSDETGSEKLILQAYRAMEPDARYHLEAIAKALAPPDLAITHADGSKTIIEVKTTSDSQNKGKPG